MECGQKENYSKKEKRLEKFRDLVKRHSELVEEELKILTQEESKITVADFERVLLSEKGKKELVEFKSGKREFQFKAGIKKLYEKFSELEKKKFVMWLMVKNRLEAYIDLKVFGEKFNIHDIYYQYKPVRRLVTYFFDGCHPLPCSIEMPKICVSYNPLCSVFCGLDSERSLYNLKSIWELDHTTPKKQLRRILHEKGFLSKDWKSTGKVLSEEQAKVVIEYFFSSVNLKWSCKTCNKTKGESMDAKTEKKLAVFEALIDGKQSKRETLSKEEN